MLLARPFGPNPCARGMIHEVDRRSRLVETWRGARECLRLFQLLSNVAADRCSLLEPGRQRGASQTRCESMKQQGYARHGIGLPIYGSRSPFGCGRCLCIEPLGWSGPARSTWRYACGGRTDADPESPSNGRTFIGDEDGMLCTSRPSVAMLILRRSSASSSSWPIPSSWLIVARPSPPRAPFGRPRPIPAAAANTRSRIRAPSPAAGVRRRVLADKLFLPLPWTDSPAPAALSPSVNS